MALHGEIRANHQLLGQWEARRDRPALEVGEARDMTGVSIYACEMAIFGTAGTGMGPLAVKRFEVEHRFADGALVLAAKVLAMAAEL